MHASNADATAFACMAHLHSAAHLGRHPAADMSPLTFSLQALLERHEAYITESENERRTMAAHIESLEADKQSLERTNADVIEENRHLLDQLEALNNAVADSDAHVTSLQATLASTQREMQRLTQLAARTDNLERQLADFEREQATWQSSLDSQQRSERSAVRRWQTAERTLAHLQEQIEQIEKEATEERERHAEIVGRMERRHAVEKELGSAADRLKNAASLKNGDGPGNGVVSHFVKDILQDNANLQMGIVELREMLNNSNEEVENLRNQLSLHQPADEGEELQQVPERKTLGAEMDRRASQEVHVHHHYHAPSAAPKPPPIRKPRKKRYSAFASGHATPPSGASTPRSSFSYSTPASASAILQQTAASVPHAISHGKHWSMQSNQTYYSAMASSGPGSPDASTNRASSVFDRVFSDAGQDSSRPTTPDTEEPGSPVLAAMYSKRTASGWGRTVSAPVVQWHGIVCGSARQPSLDAIMSIEELPTLEQPAEKEAPIREESEDTNDIEAGLEIPPVLEPSSSIASPLSEESPDPPQQELVNAPVLEAFNPLKRDTYFHPPLRRAGSHDSLLSISGMDIHTLKNRPSQLLAPYAGRTLTSQAVISDTTAHAARPVAMSRTSTSGRTLLSGMAAEQRAPPKPTLGKKVGGWVFGRWGATPASDLTTADARTGAATANAATKTSASTAVKSTAVPTAAAAKKVAGPSKASAATPIPVKKPAVPVSGTSDKAPAAEKLLPSSPKKGKARPPGINQAGSIEGFFADIRPPPSVPVLKSLDEEALRSLLDGS